METKGNTRRGSSHRLSEGRRDRNPWTVRRWKEQSAGSGQLGNMLEGGRGERDHSAPVALALDDFQRPRGLVELRPLERRQLRLASASQSSRDGEITQVRRTRGEDRFNRVFVRQHNRVAPLAQSADCVERWVALAPSNGLRIGQNPRNGGQITPYSRNPDDATTSGNDSSNDRPVYLSDHASSQVGLAESEALQVTLACRRSDLPLHVFGPCDDRLRPVNRAVSCLRLKRLESRVAKAAGLLQVGCVERLPILLAVDFRAQKPGFATKIHVGFGQGVCPLLCPVGARSARFSRNRRATHAQQIREFVACSKESGNRPITWGQRFKSSPGRQFSSQFPVDAHGRELPCNRETHSRTQKGVQEGGALPRLPRGYKYERQLKPKMSAPCAAWTAGVDVKRT